MINTIFNYLVTIFGCIGFFYVSDQLRDYGYSWVVGAFVAIVLLSFVIDWSRNK